MLENMSCLGIDGLKSGFRTSHESRVRAEGRKRDPGVFFGDLTPGGALGGRRHLRYVFSMVCRRPPVTLLE